MSEPLRYARQQALARFGTAGQQALARSRVLLVGLGGLGCPAAQYLAGAGIGSLVLNDFDRVDDSNLARQILFTAADVGRPKVEAAAAALARLNPAVGIETVDRRLTDDEMTEAVDRADIVLDGTDNLPTRLRVNAACVRTATALIAGAVIRLEGQLMVFPNDGGGAPCYRCLYEEADEGLGDCRGSGVLGPAAGAIGCLMAGEAIKLLAGVAPAPAGKLLLLDLADWNVRALAAPARPDCPECGPQARTRRA